MRDVYLYGAVGREFGRHYRLEVDSPAEALRAVCMLRPGLRQRIRQGQWRVIVGSPHLRNEIDAACLLMNAGAQAIHFVPASQAAGGGGGKGIGGILLGAVAIGAAFIPGIGPMVSAGIFSMGLSMVAGGVASMLAPTPSPAMGGATAPEQEARVEDRPSFMFNGVTNNSQQGASVPLVFGRHLCGSTVISAGIYVEAIPP